VRFALDTSGKKLYKLSSYKPFLVKPNKYELSEIFEDKIDSEEKIVKYARKLIDQGAENVIVSLGKDGSMFIDSNIVYKARPIEGKLINSVGSGDSMVAGYIYGYMKGFSKLDSYKLAVSCGSATAFSPDIAEKELIDEIFKKVELEEWE
ncbi:MAG: 1-phosphofructokinase family hexose kinase, partial [Anaerococcus obesiensis]